MSGSHVNTEHAGEVSDLAPTLLDMADETERDPALATTDLEQLAIFGDDGPDGPATAWSLTRFPEFAIPIRRLNLVFCELARLIATVLTLIPSLTCLQMATKRIINSVFKDETFPESWFRPAPVLGSSIPSQIAAALPQWPPPPFNISSSCANYWDSLVNAIPGTLANVTGIFKQNVDLLTGILFKGSGYPEPLAPAGPTNI
ncbi:hypothetical protein C8J57DRAFT_1680872 [Mycena rebaudengoi]|nr:hypothetical protein C8J57DRAFT_1680872 [Mycena rebaudengoi]